MSFVLRSPGLEVEVCGVDGVREGDVARGGGGALVVRLAAAVAHDAARGDSGGTAAVGRAEVGGLLPFPA